MGAVDRPFVSHLRVQLDWIGSVILLYAASLSAAVAVLWGSPIWLLHAGCLLVLCGGVTCSSSLPLRPFELDLPHSWCMHCLVAAALAHESLLLLQAANHPAAALVAAHCSDGVFFLLAIGRGALWGVLPCPERARWAYLCLLGLGSAGVWTPALLGRQLSFIPVRNALALVATGLMAHGLTTSRLHRSIQLEEAMGDLRRALDAGAGEVAALVDTAASERVWAGGPLAKVNMVITGTSVGLLLAINLAWRVGGGGGGVNVGHLLVSSTPVLFSIIGLLALLCRHKGSIRRLLHALVPVFLLLRIGINISEMRRDVSRGNSPAAPSCAEGTRREHANGVQAPSPPPAADSALHGSLTPGAPPAPSPLPTSHTPSPSPPPLNPPPEPSPPPLNRSPSLSPNPTQTSPAPNSVPGRPSDALLVWTMEPLFDVLRGLIVATVPARPTVRSLNVLLLLMATLTRDWPRVMAAAVSGDGDGDASMGVSRKASVDASADVSRDASRDASKDVSRDTSRDASGDVSSDVFRDLSADVSSDMSMDASSDMSMDASILKLFLLCGMPMSLIGVALAFLYVHRMLFASWQREFILAQLEVRRKEQLYLLRRQAARDAVSASPKMGNTSASPETGTVPASPQTGTVSASPETGIVSASPKTGNAQAAETRPAPEAAASSAGIGTGAAARPPGRPVIASGHSPSKLRSPPMLRSPLVPAPVVLAPALVPRATLCPPKLVFKTPPQAPPPPMRQPYTTQIRNSHAFWSRGPATSVTVIPLSSFVVGAGAAPPLVGAGARGAPTSLGSLPSSSSTDSRSLSPRSPGVPPPLPRDNGSNAQLYNWHSPRDDLTARQLYIWRGRADDLAAEQVYSWHARGPGGAAAPRRTRALCKTNLAETALIHAAGWLAVCLAWAVAEAVD